MENTKMSGKMQHAVRWIAVALASLMGVQVLVTTPLLTWFQITSTHDVLGYTFSLLIAIAAIGSAMKLGRHLAPTLAVLDRSWSNIPAGRWLILIGTLGIILRVGWIVFFPTAPSSDGATYLHLATKLHTGESYEVAGTRAYWPPGYPFFLDLWLFLPVDNLVAVIISNLALFGATLWVAFRLAEKAGGPLAARLTSLILALWPTYAANAGLPEKEHLLILLIPLAIWLYVHRPDGRRTHFLRASTAGIVLGLACLTQPSMLLFALVFLAYELANRTSLKSTVFAMGLLVLGMALTIAPWTWRNLQTFNRPVLISTSGGDNLYRANNPLATGGWTPRGEVDLSVYDELEENREGFRLALQWITNHPGDFARLLVRKQMLFLGDDSVGIYNTLSRGHGAATHPVLYLVLKGIANIWWYGLWLLSLAALWNLRRKATLSPIWTTMSFGYAYFYAIHSVFESSSKYHTPALALLAVMVGVLLSQLAQTYYPSRRIV